MSDELYTWASARSRTDSKSAAALEAEGWQEAGRHPIYGTRLMKKDASLDYGRFIAEKHKTLEFPGIEPGELNPKLFDFQRDMVRWALRRGRAAIFADCGMGKSFIQLEWARHIPGRVLILAPLAVAQQTVREAHKFGLEAHYARDGKAHGQITVTNYDMLDHFNPADFAGVVLDESSILKAFDGKTRTRLIEAFGATPFRLACTATPAPNDFMELGNHSEFLGIASRSEMLATYFVHDGGDTSQWRIKGHAVTEFWRWVCSWAAMLRRPSDLGYKDDGFILPELDTRELLVPLEVETAHSAGMLFPMDALTLVDQRAVRRASVGDRAKAIAAIVNDSEQPWVVWCELNDEADAIEAAIPDAIQIKGADENADKEAKLLAFASGDERVLVTKPSIAGFGMNWQHCADIVFAAPSHSFEMTYQAIRLCWRFGQKRPVTVWMTRTDADGAIVENLRRKEADAERMAERMIQSVAGFQNITARAIRQMTAYAPDKALEVPKWLAA